MGNNAEEFYSKRRSKIKKTAERKRINEYTAFLKNCNDPQGKNWRKWGCYLSERQWGTVRENYSVVNNSWGDNGDNATFPRDQALNRAYRWGEDGIAGISDDHQFLCFYLALWNGSDPCIKERLYGLTNSEGNHGEDVKEYYFYVDNTPTHSYMKYTYKYPYYYDYKKIFENRGSINPFEYEPVNAGLFSQNKYFNIDIEYAKNDVEDILIRVTAKNCGEEIKTLHLLPTALFRNTWSYIKDDEKSTKENYIKTMTKVSNGNGVIEIIQSNKNDNSCDKKWLYCDIGYKEMLFTENETDNQTVFGSSNKGKYFKNGINNYLIGKYTENKSECELAGFTNQEGRGTKASVHYELTLNPGETRTISMRLSNVETTTPLKDFDECFKKRLSEADDFYDSICPYDRNGSSNEQDMYNIQRQAFAGMLWNKQLYHLIVEDWLEGDSVLPSDAHQKDEKMTKWRHMYCKDILSMPDKWEYPWFASWDLAFHTVTLSIIDPEFAKHQLILLCMEWFMHPNGQIPAYEWDFCNVNPPVHAWAAWNVYNQEKLIYGTEDKDFLERIFDKLNLNFTWWINNVDPSKGNDNVFGGGFLGLDNIRVVDKDPSGKNIEQADGTSWMAMFCLNMMKIAHELSRQDLQRKYLQHFIYICDAMNNIGKKDKKGLWNESEGFFFDYANEYGSLLVYSAVGLVPLFAIDEIKQTNTGKDGDCSSFESLNGTLEWFQKNRSDLIKNNDHINIENKRNEEMKDSTMFQGYVSVVDKQKLPQILKNVLDSNKFLSDYGIRSLAKDTNYNWYGNNICYEPAESNKVKIMGGNSNWRGPIWFPINYLLVESLRKYSLYVDGNITISDSETSQVQKNLDNIADDISNRLISIFKKDKNGKRPVYGGQELFERDGWQDLVLFYEYFHGDNGAGLGASHQTGWTGLVANLIQELGTKKK